MRNSPNDPYETLPLQPESDHYILAMLYYGFFVVATAAIVLMLYHCLIILWCTNTRSSRRGTGATTVVQSTGGQKPSDLASVGTTYKYKGRGVCDECVVCLSMFEEGEDVRELPRCNHSFHSPCIDKWLFSHFDCPLCRSLVTGELESSGDVGFSDSGLRV